MNILYYDCFCGISGDMNIGALIDLGVDIDYLKAELKKLSFEDEYELHVTQGMKMGIRGTKFDVELKNSVEDHDHDHDHKHDHDHDHDHDHKHDHNHDHKHGHNHDHEHSSKKPHIHRTFAMIKEMIQTSQLSERVKKQSIEIFYLIAVAEGKVHNKPIEEVHFHEVGATDSIIDIVGAAICLEALDIHKVLASSIQVGGGFVKCAHGKMPVPAPATAEILHDVPMKYNIVPFETTTPTGAAVLKATVSEYTDQPSIKVSKIGYGLGFKDFEIPNILRVYLASEQEVSVHNDISMDDLEQQTQYMIETNLDDMSSEGYPFVEELLFQAGALDVYKTSIMMKKGRPAIKLSILFKKEIRQDVLDIVFKHTTAAGVREVAVEKYMLRRAVETVDTCYGTIRVKHLYYQGIQIKSKPEYEDCAKAAKEHHVRLTDVYDQVAQGLLTTKR